MDLSLLCSNPKLWNGHALGRGVDADAGDRRADHDRGRIRRLLGRRHRGHAGAEGAV